MRVLIWGLAVIFISAALFAAEEKQVSVTDGAGTDAKKQAIKADDTAKPGQLRYVNLACENCVISDDVEKMLLENNISSKPKGSVGQSFIIKFTNARVIVEQQTKHSLQVTVSAYRYDEKVKATNARAEFMTVRDTEEATLQKQKTRLIIQALKAFLTRTDLNEFFK